MEKSPEALLEHLIGLQKQTFAELHTLLAFPESDAIKKEEERLMRSLYGINAHIEDVKNLISSSGRKNK